jgi:urease accessory protein UreF
MDDGRLGGGMTLADIARRLDTIQSDMAQGFQRVDEALNAAKVRDEEILGTAKVGLEAMQMLEEKVDRRFADTDRAMADQKALIETAIRATARGR